MMRLGRGFLSFVGDQRVANELPLYGDESGLVTDGRVPIPDLRWSGVPMAGFGLLLSFRAYTESELFGLNCRWA